MNFQPFYQSRQLDDSVAVKAGFNPYYPEIQSGLSDPILIERKQFINLASNNYLGLSNDSRLKEAAINAIRKYHGLEISSILNSNPIVNSKTTAPR